MILAPLDLDNIIQNSTRPILIDFGASWCGPCRDIALTLTRLAATDRERIVIVNVDIEQHSEIAARYQIRSIPTLALIVHGIERGRFSGSKNLHQLKSWLSEFEINVNSTSDDFENHLEWSAFFGSALEKHKIIEKASRSLRENKILPSHAPFFRNGFGTPSACMVASGDPRVYQNFMGMPYSFACSVDFAGFNDATSCSQLLQAIPVGANLSEVAPKILLRWACMCEPAWRAFSSLRENIHLLYEWIDYLEKNYNVCGMHSDMLTKISEEAKRVIARPGPTAKNFFIDIIARAAPLPLPGDFLWSSILVTFGHWTKIALLQVESGWDENDFLYFDKKTSWFSERIPCSSTGSIDPQELDRAHKVWDQENREFSIKEGAWLSELPGKLDSKNNKIQNDLIRTISNAERDLSGDFRTS